MTPPTRAALSRGTADAEGGGPLVKLYMDRFGTPVGAANLCASLRDHVVDGVHVDDALLGAVLDQLATTRGEALNRYARST
ncbi:MAG: hypothetical protein ABI193_26720 [Minicystis sp.]